MAPAQWAGLLMAILAGALVGTSPWPIKLMRVFRYEHWAFLSAALGMLVLPWAMALALCPDALGACAGLPWWLLVRANLFSVAWGVANVLCLLALVRIGVALTIGLLTGVGLPVGVLVPIVFRGSGLFQNAPHLGSSSGRVILASVAAMIGATILMTVAGFGRDAALARSGRRAAGFLPGLLMAVAAGVLQAGLSFSFVYSQGPIAAAVEARGAGAVGSIFAVWAMCLVGGGLANVLYPAWLMTRRGTWHVLARGGAELALPVAMGVTFAAFIALMGRSMQMLGALGASVGFGVYQAFQIAGSQALGFASGEWRGVAGRPRLQMYAAIGILIAAVAAMAWANAHARP